jgi:Na+/H+-dicarboxylate symporter
MFRSIQFILICLIVFLGVFNPWIPLVVKSCLLASSLFMKSLILFILPFLIFALIFQTSANMAKTSTLAIFALLGFVVLSNFTSTMLSFFAGKIAYQFDLSLLIPDNKEGLKPFFDVTIKSLVSNSQALICGIIAGISCGFLWPDVSKQVAGFLDRVIHVILKGIFWSLPCFISGFIVKLLEDGTFVFILKQYALIFTVVIGALLVYISGLYFVASRLGRSSFKDSIKRMLPAAFVGFGTMSSAAAMPLTLVGVEKNSLNPKLAKSIIPATVNIHLIGDCFAIPIFAFAILKSFGMPEPTFFSFLPFALAFVVAKFSVAAVPGGGVLVMLPILESYLGLNGEMLSLITALYILFDPVITASNVLGNGAFAQLIDSSITRKNRIKI